MIKSSHSALLFAAFLMSTSATQAAPLYYGGDFDPNNPNVNGLANEVDSTVSDARTYDNFTVSGSKWHVTGLFTNNLMEFTDLSNTHWEIRSGVSQGNGGTLLFSGDSVATVTPTGRGGFGYTEYQVLVGVSFDLDPGTYWMSVQPQAPGAAGRSFESNTFGLNAVGTHTADLDFFDSPFFGANFDLANNYGINPGFSSGVEGTTGVTGVPEPSSLALFGSALFGAIRWRRKKNKA